MRFRAGIVLTALLLAAPACGPKTTVVPPPAVSPRFPEFVEPAIPPGLAGGKAVEPQRRAWLFLQVGDVRNADREVSAALKAVPDFFPAEATGGYIELARKDPRAAVARFDRALQRQADYVPALLGKGQALVALNRESEAIAVLQSAVAADASLTEVQRQIDVLKFRVVQQGVTAARDAAGAGKKDEALRAYREAIAQSPDTAFLYREVAAIERDLGNSDQALADLRKAASLDPGDVTTLVQLGDLLAAREDLDGAVKAYDAALAIEPDAAVTDKRSALRARTEMAGLPPEHQAIAAAGSITRGDLAALIGVRLASLLQSMPVKDVGVMTDVRRHWAESWILGVARAGVLDPFENHTFQPETIVRRVEFVQAVTRLLNRVAEIAPGQATRWANARGKFPDMTAGHLAYPAASVATAAGVIAVDPDGSFNPTRPVTGAEASAALEAVRRMVPGPLGGRP
jgi:tetratricopeptide (TPR) repeat protein